MDSGLFNGAAYCNNNGKVEMVDLTLKLGLPYEAKNPSHLRQHVNHVPTTPDFAYTASQAAPNFSYATMMMGGGGAATNNYGMGGGNYGMTGGGIATNNYEMGGGRAATNNYEMGGGGAATNNYEIGGGRAATNNYGMINRMGNAVMGNIGSNLLGGQNLNSWAYDMGSSSTGGILRHHQQYPTGIPAYQNINGGLTLPPFQAHSLTSYTLLDCSPFEARQTGKSSSVARRPRNGNNNNPYRRCTNCNTNDTPMWRKGPLGPKSLCNACGIKYQKEEGKRKAKEAAKDSKA